MKKALVAGALGVTGRTLVNHLVSLGDWEVIGLPGLTPSLWRAHGDDRCRAVSESHRLDGRE